MMPSSASTITASRQAELDIGWRRRRECTAVKQMPGHLIGHFASHELAPTPALAITAALFSSERIEEHGLITYYIEFLF